MTKTMTTNHAAPDPITQLAGLATWEAEQDTYYGLRVLNGALSNESFDSKSLLHCLTILEDSFLQILEPLAEENCLPQKLQPTYERLKKEEADRQNSSKSKPVQTQDSQPQSEVTKEESLTKRIGDQLNKLFEPSTKDTTQGKTQESNNNQLDPEDAERVKIAEVYESIMRELKQWIDKRVAAQALLKETLIEKEKAIKTAKEQHTSLESEIYELNVVRDELIRTHDQLQLEVTQQLERIEEKEQKDKLAHAEKAKALEEQFKQKEKGLKEEIAILKATIETTKKTVVHGADNAIEAQDSQKQQQEIMLHIEQQTRKQKHANGVAQKELQNISQQIAALEKPEAGNFFGRMTQRTRRAINDLSQEEQLIQLKLKKKELEQNIAVRTETIEANEQHLVQLRKIQDDQTKNTDTIALLQAELSRKENAVTALIDDQQTKMHEISQNLKAQLSLHAQEKREKQSKIHDIEKQIVEKNDLIQQKLAALQDAEKRIAQEPYMQKLLHEEALAQSKSAEQALKENLQKQLATLSNQKSEEANAALLSDMQINIIKGHDRKTQNASDTILDLTEEQEGYVQNLIIQYRDLTKNAVADTTNHPSSTKTQNSLQVNVNIKDGDITVEIFEPPTDYINPVTVLFANISDMQGQAYLPGISHPAAEQLQTHSIELAKDAPVDEQDLQAKVAKTINIENLLEQYLNSNATTQKKLKQTYDVLKKHLEKEQLKPIQNYFDSKADMEKLYSDNHGVREQAIKELGFLQILDEDAFKKSMQQKLPTKIAEILNKELEDGKTIDPTFRANLVEKIANPLQEFCEEAAPLKQEVTNLVRDIAQGKGHKLSFTEQIRQFVDKVIGYFKKPEDSIIGDIKETIKQETKKPQPTKARRSSEPITIDEATKKQLSSLTIVATGHKVPPLLNKQPDNRPRSNSR